MKIRVITECKVCKPNDTVDSGNICFRKCSFEFMLAHQMVVGLVFLCDFMSVFMCPL